MSFDLHLNGLRAVVTGGTLGLGAAVVKTLVDAGALVATSARTLPAQPVEGVTLRSCRSVNCGRCESFCSDRPAGLGWCRYPDQRAWWLKDSRWWFRWPLVMSTGSLS